MGTTRKPMSGRAQSDYPSNLDKYNKDSKAKSVGRHMRTFARTKTSRVITTWDDSNYFSVVNNQLKIVGDTTGNVDNATTGSAQFLAWLDETWELFYTNANLKDLDATEESYWKDYFSCAFFIKYALQVQYTFRCYLPAYTEADDVPGDTTNIPYFSQSSFDIMVASMKDFPIPKGIDHLISLLCGWVIQLSQPYEQFSLSIPGAFIYPWNCDYDLGDLEGARERMRVTMGRAITHAKKFGLKMGSWSDPVKPVVKQISDSDVIAYLNHAQLQYYDKANAVPMAPNGGFGGSNSTTEWTNTEYCFKDNPNESEIHVLAPIFGVYDATHNKFGGWVLETVAAAEYACGAMCVAQHGTNISPFDIASLIGKYFVLLYKGWTDNLLADGELNLMVSGTEVTADKGMDDSWPIVPIFNLYVGSGRGMTESNNDLINYLGRLLT